MVYPLSVTASGYVGYNSTTASVAYIVPSSTTDTLAGITLTFTANVYNISGTIVGLDATCSGLTIGAYNGTTLFASATISKCSTYYITWTYGATSSPTVSGSIIINAV
jgi:hypothetical protein